MKKLTNRAKGDLGESVAAKFLLGKNYELKTRNYHSVGGEIDLLMFDKIKKEWVIVEVKTKTGRGWNDPRNEITDEKMDKMMDAWAHYCDKKLNLDNLPDFRLEFVLVYLDLENRKARCELVTNLW